VKKYLVMSKKTQILTLIESDIISSKLINTFKNINIDADLYQTDISTVIFERIGISKADRTDKLYEKYFSMVNKGRIIDFSQDKTALETYTSEIYTYLVNFKS
jgi:hypothetical protein